MGNTLDRLENNTTDEIRQGLDDTDLLILALRQVKTDLACGRQIDEFLEDNIDRVNVLVELLMMKRMTTHSMLRLCGLYEQVLEHKYGREDDDEDEDKFEDEFTNPYDDKDDDDEYDDEYEDDEEQ